MSSLKNLARRMKDLFDDLTGNFGDGLDAAGDGFHRGLNDAKRFDPEFPSLFLHPNGSVAAHEAGHALVCWRSPSVLKIVSTKLRENGGGQVTHLDTTVPTNVSRWYEIAVCLAGIAAEIELYGRFHGKSCKSDLLNALKHAKKMVAEGRDINSCPWENDERVRTIDFSCVYVSRPPKAVNDILCASFRRARANITEFRTGFMKLSTAILRRGELDHDAVIEVLGPRPFNEKILF